jgi:DNA-binding winged helix-turn-helix (wHTH) protein/tetratricopeptide (TPR) repeat protein
MGGAPQPLDLAQETDFQLGPLRVSPSTCRVHDGGREDRLEARVMAVLVTLARAAPHTVSREDLIDACWGGRIVSDDAIARALAKLRALARSRTPPAFSVETVTKVGFRIILQNESAQAASPEAQANLSVVATIKSWRPLLLPAAGLAAVALIAAFALRTPSHRQTYMTIATFEQRDDGMERLSGLTRDALLEMTAASGIAVSSARGAAEAEFALEGALHREDQSAVVTLRLVHNASSIALWSRSFTGDKNGEPALADTVADKSIGVLRCIVAEREHERRRIEPATLALYLNVCDAAIMGDVERTVSTARTLVSAVPANATAHALLAQALTSAADMTRTAGEIAALRAEAVEEAERALSMDRNQPRAYLALAHVAQARTAWAERERLIQRALEIDPTSFSGRNTYVYFLRQVGRWREAETQSQSVHSGPHGPAGALPLLALLQGSQGDVQRAYETVDRYARIYPSSSPQLRWTILVWWDDVDRARELNATWGAELPDSSIACFDWVLSRATAPSRSAELPPPCGQFSNDWKARMLARAGNIEAALRTLDAPDTGELRTTIALFYPEMSAVRADPRFIDVARRHGLLEYWRETERAPDFCTQEARAPVCQAIRNSS